MRVRERDVVNGVRGARGGAVCLVERGLGPMCTCRQHPFDWQLRYQFGLHN